MKTELPFLSTKRLLLFPPSLKDLSFWVALHSDPDVMKFMGGPRDKNEVKEWLETDIAHFKKHGFSMFSIVNKNNEFVGRAGLVYLDYDDAQKEIEVGYVLKKEFWNKGYATEIVTALVSWGFKNLKIPRLVSVTRPENRKCQHILKKVGMEYKQIILFHDETFLLYEIRK